jgi:hypothetical protein
MSNAPKHDGDAVRERHAADSERPSTLAPALEISHGEGYRRAWPDTTDLDPPATFPPL